MPRKPHPFEPSPRETGAQRLERLGILRPRGYPVSRSEGFAAFTNRGGRISSDFRDPSHRPPPPLHASTIRSADRYSRIYKSGPSLSRIFGEGMVQVHNYNRTHSMRVEDIPLSRERPGRPEAIGYAGTLERRDLRLRLYSPDEDRPLPEVLADVAGMSGAPLAYLEHVVSRESSGDPNAAASTSQAFGLTQFVPDTWIAYMRGMGPRYGWPPTMSDEETLSLRGDERWSAIMAGEYGRRNHGVFERELAPRVGRSATFGDLYVMHFGDQSGVNLLRAYYGVSARGASATRYFTGDQVRNNLGVFFHRNAAGDDIDYSHPRTVAELYSHMAGDQTLVQFTPRRDGSTDPLE